MILTPEQRAAVGSEGRFLAVRGGPGTGKTTVLVERYRRLTQEHPPSRVLVVCGDRAAANRFRDRVLPGLRGGFDWLPITTIAGVAHDLVARSAAGPAPELRAGAPQRALVRRLLAREDPRQWPALGRFLGRPPFADEVIAGLTALREVGAGVADEAGGHWAELAGFARRYAAALAQSGQVDVAGLLDEASAGAAGHRSRFDHILVDDAGGLSAGGLGLVIALAGDAAVGGPCLFLTSQAAVAVSGSEGAAHELRHSFRTAPPGTLVRCGHPSSEPEAIAGALTGAHRQGVAWADMAVLVRHLGRRARSVGRALARHGIPVVPAPALAREEPVVRAVVDLLRWVDGDESALDTLVSSPLARLAPFVVRDVRQSAALSGTPLEADPRLAHLAALRDHLRSRAQAGDRPADLAYEAWSHGLSHVGQTGLGAVDDRALDALVALVDGLAAHAERHPRGQLGEALAALADGALVPESRRSPVTEGVTITSIAASAGRQWHTVIVAGCVEGELPRPPVRTPLFDPTLLGRPPVDDDQRLWAIATSRASNTLLATAAPEPGVLLSRYVEAWPEAEPVLPLAPGLPSPPRAVTAGPSPVWAEGELRLSASQLDTYADCPLRYAYQYVLRARDDAGIHAELGTFVHRVLATFLDPDAEEPAPRTWEGLLAVADTLWSDEIGRYWPQIEEARKDAVAMLQAWWEEEGSKQLDVLAVERRFDIAVGPHRLTGSIDRVDRADPAGAPAPAIRIVDYKTGKREPSASDVAEDLQLAIYHLAATRDPQLATWGEPAELQLRYLRSMHSYAQTVTEGHAEATEARVLAVAERMLAEEFDPAVDANCRTCTFHRLCPLQDEGRQVRGAR